ncbi:MAG: pentapeptide repeat-containing protein [Lachnospiraceae bacterium]|nr:pentapeptide repeat-containing protein [Lachnospiraceae bacterium]
MKRCWKKFLRFIFKIPILFSVGVAVFALLIYGYLVHRFRFGMNMTASTVISTDIALITIIITSIGLSISGYIFLNGYFGTVTEGDQSLASIIEGLNKTYILKIVVASIASAVFIAFGFIVIFIVKDNGVEDENAFRGIQEYILQHLAYVGSIGSILYNFHFLCHIINPNRLIQNRAVKVVKEEIIYFERQYDNLPSNFTDSGHLWEKYKEKSEKDSIRHYGGKSERRSFALSKQTLKLIKYIHEVETIITKVIELNAIKGRNRSKEEALKFVFADTTVGEIKYERRIKRLYNYECHYNSMDFKIYEQKTSELIERYVEYYEHLVLLRNALVKIDKKEEQDIEISDDVSKFVVMMLYITLDYFSNFVRITKLNIGGGYFQEAYLSWSDLSDSNLTGSNFSHAYMKGAVLLNSDLSNSKLDYADLSDADLKNVNLGYASLIGTDCTSINLTNAKLTDVTFHDRRDICIITDLKKKIIKIFQLESIDWEKLEQYSEQVSYLKVLNKTKLDVATLDYVMLKSINLSCLDLSGASFVGSVLTNSLWLNTTKAVGVKMQNANLRNSLAVKSDFSMSDFQFCNLGKMIFVDVDMNQSSLANVSGFLMKILGSSEKILVSKDEQQSSLSFNNPLFAEKDFKIDRIKETNRYSKWTQINFQNLNAVESWWYNTILNESDFKGATLKNAIFQNIAANWVNMEECDLTYSRISNVSFRMAKMNLSVFTRCFLKNVSFEDANLFRSNFIHANVRYVDYIQCNLGFANFSHTLFYKCKFLNCEVDRIYLQSTTFEHVTFDVASFFAVLESYKENNDVTFASCIIMLDDEQSTYESIQKAVTDQKASSLELQKKEEEKFIRINE